VVVCLNTEYNVSSGIIPRVGVVGSCCGFSGETSVYPKDRDIKDEVMLDLMSGRFVQDKPDA
jgi:hypothetical protein